MKKAFVLVIFFVLASSVFGATLKVSQPIMTTNNSYYERGQSIAFDGTNYWLFYGRSASVTGNYGNSNPDISDYQIYYKKATTIAGLPGAAPQAVTGADNIFQGQTSAVIFDGKVWVFAADETTADHSIKGWHTDDGGASWVENDTGFDGGGSPHLWAIVHDGKVFIAYNAQGNVIQIREYSSGWSEPTNASTNEGMPRFYEDSGGNLHMIWVSWGMPAYYIHTYNSGWSTTADYSITGTAYDDCDPALFQIGGDGNYSMIYAPWDGTKQYLAAWTASSLSGLNSATSHQVTEGSGKTTSWVDMWPVVINDGTDDYLFFTSERKNDGTRDGGNIWYLKIDWSTNHEHYTFVQKAVDAASLGDTIDISAGTYIENIVLTNEQGLTIHGAGASTLIEPSTGIGFRMSDSDGITIHDLKIHTIGMNAHGIWVGGTPNGYGDSDTLKVERVMINISGKSSGIYAEQVDTPHNGWEISDSTIDAPNLGVNIELYDVDTVLLDNNTLGKSGSACIVYASENSNVGGAVISNCVFAGNGNIAGVTPAIWIESDFQTGDGSSAIDGVKIDRNIFNDWTNYAIRLGESSANFDRVSNVNISYNKFLSGSSPIALDVGSYVGGNAKASYNYWGAVSGPGGIGFGSGYNITRKAEFSPFFSDSGLTALVYDDDADGFEDSTDKLVVNLAAPNETMEASGFSNMVLDIGGDENTAINQSALGGDIPVMIKDGAETVMEFLHDFAERGLDLSSVRIVKTPGSMIVRGLNLTSGSTKSVYVDIADGPVCVKDAEVQSLAEISDNCDGPGETLFVTCSGTIGNVTCQDIGSRYNISGLVHSAVENTSTTKLFIGDSAEGGFGVTNNPVSFYANYTNISSGAIISGATCQVLFSDTGSWVGMDWNGAQYNYTRTFTLGGSYTWNVTCSKAGFDTLYAQDDVDLIEGAVPEFGAAALLLAGAVLFAGICIVRKKEVIA